MNQIDLVKLNEYTINLIEAAREYLARKDDENRVLQFGRNIVVEQSHAHGGYSYYDWIPFASEACKCCTSHNGHKMTGRTLQDHFRSPTHVSTLYNVCRSDLIKFAFIYKHMLFSNKKNSNTAVANMGSY